VIKSLVCVALLPLGLCLGIGGDFGIASPFIGVFVMFSALAGLWESIAKP